MKPCLIFFASFFAPLFLFAQTLTGTVNGPDGQPVSYATVALEETRYGATSNELGQFTVPQLPAGEYVVYVVAPGFAIFRQTVVLTSQKTYTLNVVLEEEAFQMPQVNILADKYRLLRELPGSAGYINSRELALLAPVSGNEVFRRVPGVHVVDEEGAGLRVNIGLRGLDPDRSRNVLVLEDGVPVALSPYGEPEMYYTPAMDRMAGVEVLKGSGQILFGPQTIGGVVNYITADPPQEETIKARLVGGQGGYFSGLVSYGNTFGNTGVQVSLLRRQADNIGPTEFVVNDLSAKFKLLLNDKSAIGVKIGVYDEVSNSTYVGITQPMFDQGGQDFVRLAPNDQLDVRRYSLSATHEYRATNRISIKTTAFGYTTARNWRRQDFSYDPNASRKTGVVWGDPSIPGGAIYMRNSTGNRDRQFEVAGIEPRLTWKYDLGRTPGELQAGARYLYERAFEQRINGTTAQATSGELVEDEIRTGVAWSAFAQNKFNLSSKITLTAGVRLERYGYEREILRRRYGGVLRDTSVVAENELVSLIPGVGVNFALAKNLNLFGGIHRGFAPPRIKDAISAEGEAYELDAEQSWNSEVGLRGAFSKSIFAEVAAFVMDFSNQIIPVSVSSGGAGAGLVNGGRTYHHGVEASVNFGVGQWFQAPFRLDVDVNATLQEARFNGDRFVTIQNESINIGGNRTPYAPNLLLSSAVTFETVSGFQARLTQTYVSAQFTDEENTLAPAANGRSGQMPAYFLLDATLQYTFSKAGITFLLSGKNLTNERYIASRRPEGIRVGLPRFITGGVSLSI